MSARFSSGAQMWALPPGHVHKHLHRPGLLVIYEVFFHPNVLGFLSNTVVVCFFFVCFFLEGSLDLRVICWELFEWTPVEQIV